MQEEASTRELHHDVTVIGAGWSGLLAMKYALEEGLTVAALERRDNLGGLWYYSDDPKEKTVMKSTIATSSSTVTEMSDYPMPDDIGIFPRHDNMLQYLDSYASQFGLREHIRFNTTADRVEKDGNTWRVRTRSGEEFTSRFLVVCVGTPAPNSSVPEVAGFEGLVQHAVEVKEPQQAHKGKRVLIVGGGETAADVCNEWYDHTSVIYWSAPRGQHFFRRYTKIVPWKKPQALDKASSVALRTIAPYHKGKPGLSWICKWTSNGSLLAYQGHGIPEWRNDAGFFRFFVNKNGKVLDLIDYKKVVPKGGIAKCDGHQVEFTDGTKQEFDVIILCTGYKTDFYFLPEQFAKKSFRQRYKFIFDNEDPTLAFVGFVRPVVGSVPAITELQARWVAKVFANRVQFQSKENRLQETEKDSTFWQDYFKDTSQRLDGLVEAFLYANDITKKSETYPNYLRLFLRSPRSWFVATFSPFNAAMYRLNEPAHEHQAIATMSKHSSNSINPLHLLLLVLLRLIWFDVWLRLLEALKYQIQTSSWWPGVRRLPTVRAANWIWCTPKRLFFDKQTSIRNVPTTTKNLANESH